MRHRAVRTASPRQTENRRAARSAWRVCRRVPPRGAYARARRAWARDLAVVEWRTRRAGSCARQHSRSSIVIWNAGVPLSQRHQLQMLDLLREKLAGDPAEALLGVGDQKLAARLGDGR